MFDDLRKSGEARERRQLGGVKVAQAFMSVNPGSGNTRTPEQERVAGKSFSKRRRGGRRCRFRECGFTDMNVCATRGALSSFHQSDVSEL